MMLGIQIAKAIISGDATRAHSLRGGKTSWSVPEARAIIAACQEANKRYGCNLNYRTFLGWA